MSSLDDPLDSLDTDYRYRVVVEKLELDARIKRLAKFMYEGATFERLDLHEKERMRRQMEAMREYATVLGARIVSFSWGAP